MDKQKEKLKISVVQLISKNNTSENHQIIKSLLESIKDPSGSLDIISFPENCFFMRASIDEKVQYMTLEDGFFDFYKNFAKQNNLLLHIGATPLLIDGKKFNATVLIYPDGTIESPYQKAHLFDIYLENKEVCESNLFERGKAPAIREYLGWKMGFSVCYDLRFSELYLYYQKSLVDLVFAPASFLYETGRYHWEILNRARAIEGQYFVVSAAQGGDHSEDQKTYGHSMVVSPWGEILVEQKESNKPSLLTTEISKEELNRVRTRMPMQSHRHLKISFS